MLKNKKYITIDNFLKKSDNKTIYEIITRNNFPFYMGQEFSTSLKVEQKLAKKDFPNLKEYYQFCHVLYNFDNNIKEKEKKSNFFFMVEYILNKYLKKFKLKYVDLWRAKVNFQPRNTDFKKNNHNTPHTDCKKSHLVLLYYVNDSDGDTFLFENNKVFKRISPKKNRLLIFDGATLHAGSHPNKSKFRIVINIDILK